MNEARGIVEAQVDEILNAERARHVEAHQTRRVKFWAHLEDWCGICDNWGSWSAWPCPVVIAIDLIGTYRQRAEVAEDQRDYFRGIVEESQTGARLVAAEREAGELRERVAEMTEANEKLRERQSWGGPDVSAELQAKVRDALREKFVRPNWPADQMIPSSEHVSEIVVAAVREAVAADPGLLAELGLEQVGFWHDKTETIARSLRHAGPDVAREADPVFRVRRS